MDKLNILQNIHVGSRVAEDEQQYLEKYFIKTNEYKLISNDDVDIVYGAKGTGKSAIYLHLIENKNEFAQKHILIIQAENARGTSAFKSVVEDPPTTENTFRDIWKLYFLILLYDNLRLKYRFNSNLKKIRNILRESGIISDNKDLIDFFTDTYRYIKNGCGSLEGRISLDPNTGMISGFSGKIIFSNPSPDAIKNGLVNIETLLGYINDVLNKKKLFAWIVLDRLDSVFAESELLEENAIRGLFKTYLDMKKYSNIRQKIFLRTDIWNKITKKGFREASHITREITISWSMTSIVNLIIKRFVENKIIEKEYSISKNDVLSSYDNQEKLFYRIFPRQIERGERKTNTINWIIIRTSDANEVVTPREIIHLIIELIYLQITNFNIGRDSTESENLFDRSLFKLGLEKVSKAKMEQTLFAEYSDLKEILLKFSEQRATNSIGSISRILGIDNEIIDLINRLQKIGFLKKIENKGGVYYSIPFLYRPYLKSIQGTSE
jgi:hypothetical protein